jgi:hypothetical protein
VAVPVMQVGVMRMRMAQGRMPVPVRMGFADRPVMRMPVVCVVAMAVFVLERSC